MNNDPSTDATTGWRQLTSFRVSNTRRTLIASALIAAACIQAAKESQPETHNPVAVEKAQPVQGSQVRYSIGRQAVSTPRPDKAEIALVSYSPGHSRTAPRITPIPAKYPDHSSATIAPVNGQDRIGTFQQRPLPSEASSISPVHIYPQQKAPPSPGHSAFALIDDGIHVYPRHVATHPGQNDAPTESAISTADGRPVHVYPVGVRIPDTESQHASKGMTSRPDKRIRAGGHSFSRNRSTTTQISQHGTQQPLSERPLIPTPDIISNSPARLQDQIFLPPAFHDQPTQPNANAVPFAAGPPSQNVETDRLSWWETDITRPVLSNRAPISFTLEQAVGRAISNAPELQVLHSDWFIRQIEIARRDAAFDWTTFVEAVWNRDSNPVSSSLDGAANRLRSRTSNASAGLRKVFRDGGQFEISQDMGTRSSNSVNISPNNQGNSRLQFEWTHPLLRGGGENYNNSRVRIAAIENDSAFDRFQAGVQDHLLNVASSYWVLVLRRGRYVQSVSSKNRAQAIATEMAQRVTVDVSPAMLDRARSEVAGRLAASIEAEHDLLRAQDAMMRLIYGPEFVRYSNNEVVTLTLPMKSSQPLQAEPQIQRAIRNRSEIHRSIRDIKIAAVQYEVAEDEILPVLNMTLTGYVAGLRGNNDIGGSIANQFTQGEPGIGVGFDFEIPYRNRAALAAAEQARVAIRRMQAELATTIADVTEDVREQVIQRNKFGAVLKPQWETLARSRRLLKTAETRREYLADGARIADLYLENLLQTQSRLERAEATYLQSQVRFAVADNSLMRAVSEIDTLAPPIGDSEGPASAVRESTGSKSSRLIDPSMDPHMSGYSPKNFDAVYEPPDAPIAR